MPALPDAPQESRTERALPALLVLPVAAGEAGCDIPSGHGRLFSRTEQLSFETPAAAVAGELWDTAGPVSSRPREQGTRPSGAQLLTSQSCPPNP